MKIKLISASAVMLLLSACGGSSANLSSGSDGTNSSSTGTVSTSQLEAEVMEFAKCFGDTGSGTSASGEVNTACTGADMQKAYDGIKCFNDNGFCEAFKTLDATKLQEVSDKCNHHFDGISAGCKSATGANY